MAKKRMSASRRNQVEADWEDDYDDRPSEAEMERAAERSYWLVAVIIGSGLILQAVATLYK